MSTHRRPIVGGNWKMNTNYVSAIGLTEDVADRCADAVEFCDVALFPPFPYLQAVGDMLGDSELMLGAQDFYHEPDGPYTGEVSLSMLQDIGVEIVLVGHSERRHVIGEADDLINAKLTAAVDAGMHVILCIGETREQRKAGETESINLTQLEAGLLNVTAQQMSQVTIAYEPVWAIGTGLTATPADAQAVHSLLRRRLAEVYDGAVAGAVRIQYGGSVKPDNARDLFAQADIDGGLIGGASLKGADFGAIVQAAVDAVCVGKTN